MTKRIKRKSHIYVVLRQDPPSTPRSDPTQGIVATRAFATEAAAGEEVERLLRLNAAKGARYFWRVARMDEPLPES